MHRNDCYPTLQGFEVFPLDYVYLTRSQKMTGGQISLLSGIKQKI